MLIKIPDTITPVKLLVKRIAIEAGNTITAETNKAQAIGIITEMTTPVIIVKTCVIKRTGKPAV